MLRTCKPSTPRAAPFFKGEKPVLEMQQLPVFRLHHSKLLPYLKKVYRTDEFDFLIAAGVTAGAVVEYNITGHVPKGRDWDYRVDQIRSGRRVNRYPDLVLNLLCREGFIPKGQYLIETKPLINAIDVYRRLLEQTKDADDERCVEFRLAHGGTPQFDERAAILDARVAEYRATHALPPEAA